MAEITNENLILELGYVFKPETRLFGKITSVICVLGIFSSIYYRVSTMAFAALLLILICILLITLKNTVEISSNSDKFRESVVFFGFKYGKWRSLLNYTDIAILTIRKVIKNEVNIGFNPAYQDPISYYEKETGVYMLTKSHRNRVLIKLCKNYKEADTFAKNTANELNKLYTVFNPIISNASLAKRKKR